MAMATLTTVTSLKQTTLSSENTRNNLRDVSFSSYLSNSDETFVRKLTESTRNLTPNVQPDYDQDVEDNNFLRNRKKEAEDGEIGVFSAEKYFNGVIEVDHSPRISKLNNIPKKKYDQPMIIKEQIIDHLVPPNPKIHLSSTPSTVGSESSWNSQIALLQQKNSNSKTKRKTNGKTGKSFLSGLGCNCICSDSDSIDVEDEHLGEISFKKGSIIAEKIPLSIVESLEKQRKSIEVFGSPLQDKKSKSFRIERKPSMLMSKRMAETEYSASSSALDNNIDSDGSSSDLFEIESLTGKVNPFLARQESDATSGCVTPTTCYAPSEASIEWSVVTASAADLSAIPDYEEIRPLATAATNFLKNGNVGETARRHPGISLGCNSSKAVRVADRIHTTDQRMRRVSDSYMPLPAIRFPLENKLMEFDSTPTQRAFSSLSLPRSRPPQTSQLFYIH